MALRTDLVQCAYVLNQDPTQLSSVRTAKKFGKLKRIREAAERLFVENGFDNATVDGIAKAAKVAKGTVFRYAASKEQLLGLIYEPKLRSALGALEAEFSDRASLERPMDEVLTTIFRRLVDVYSEHPDLARLFLHDQSALRPGDLPGIHVINGRLRALIGTCVQHWRFDLRLRGGVERDLLTDTIIRLFNGVLSDWLSGRLASADPVGVMQASFLMCGRGFSRDPETHRY